MPRNGLCSPAPGAVIAGNEEAETYCAPTETVLPCKRPPSRMPIWMDTVT